MSQEKTAKQILLEAKQLLTTNGWIKGAYADGSKYCLRGAMNSVCSDGADVFLPRRGALSKALTAVENATGCWRSVEEFNDEPSTKIEHVMDAIDRAVASLDE